LFLDTNSDNLIVFLVVLVVFDDVNTQQIA